MKRAQHRKIKRNPAAPPPRDAAPLPFDAATPPRDVTPLPLDAGPPPRDAAPLPLDAAPRDAGPLPRDAAPLPPDAAPPPREARARHAGRHRRHRRHGKRHGFGRGADTAILAERCPYAAGRTRDERDFAGKVCFHPSNRPATGRGREACPTMLSWTAAGRIRLAPELVSPRIVIGHPPTEPKPKNV